MAKKQISRILVAGLGIGVLLAVIVPVMIFVFGVGFDVLPQSNQQPLQVPVVSFCNVGEIETQDECKPILENPFISTTPIPIPTTESPIRQNETMTSDDPTSIQVIEKIIPPKNIKLEVNVVKIDSNSVKHPESFSFDIKPLALFVEDTTNIDYSKGFVEIGMNLITDPNIRIVADGIFDILINNKTIFANDVTLKGTGITDTDGKIELKFAGTSKIYTLDFGTNFQKFTNEDTTKVQFIIKSLDITAEKQYGLSDQEVYSMDIFRDDIKVLITDTEGKQVRSNLKDSRLTITSNPSEIGTIYIQKTQCPYGGNPAPSVIKYGITTITAIPLAIKIIDTTTGETIDAFAGTGKVVDIMLFRDHNYTIDHNVVDKPRSKDPFIITTPKSQANFNYNVYTDADYTTSSGGSGSSGLCTTSTTISTPITGTNHVISNFPK